MESLATCLLEETNFLQGREEEEEEEDWDEEDDEGDSPAEESTVQKQRKPNWAPCFFHYAGKEVYNYVGETIVIEEAFDSYAGMIWPAALALCHYLDTHREQFNLVDKSVLEIGAGTGLVSIVAALLGGWVTATDLPEVLSNLRANLSRNTRGRCRHTPQVEVLSWGYDLERTHPSSGYRYDYVLAADVVYHHDYLDELLATMKHFCRPGTTLIWANKVRFGTDLTFTENFKKTFETSLLVEDGEMKIFVATSKAEEEEDGIGQGMHDPLTVEEEGKEEDAEDEKKEEFGKHNETEMNSVGQNRGREKVTEEEKNLQCDEEEIFNDDSDIKDEDSEEESASSDENMSEQKDAGQTWTPSIFRRLNQDVYHYAGQDILIHESIDSYGAVMWPAALALCSYLENNKRRVNLQGKEVLELGAGTGLVTIVASLLGAAVTATDLPDVLSNLRANVARNTRGRCRHTPQVEVLSWGYDLERTHPASIYRYDYVLAADVVYHHDYLDELLATMKHFCRPGTTLIWANKVRFGTDLTFTENFKKTFNTSLLAEDGEMKIFMATSRESHTEKR